MSASCGCATYLSQVPTERARGMSKTAACCMKTAKPQPSPASMTGMHVSGLLRHEGASHQCPPGPPWHLLRGDVGVLMEVPARVVPSGVEAPEVLQRQTLVLPRFHARLRRDIEPVHSRIAHRAELDRERLLADHRGQRLQVVPVSGALPGLEHRVSVAEFWPAAPVGGAAGRGGVAAAGDGVCGRQARGVEAGDGGV
eukprot:CAMPEP_0170321952 /NCGR_PEP_ID=MMETSP0116_2-20130129/61747_1 /TAXON_ID=400756 /ORGANISM="Durinskia baltica, Strain CSIRO CS-38" /LENGTH=197 /DNA_ID=CAMNT_0010574797 /DNA_START=263 /DNA_END=856 /DNA_ORIENTATION=-